MNSVDVSTPIISVTVNLFGYPKDFVVGELGVIAIHRSYNTIHNSFVDIYYAREVHRHFQVTKIIFDVTQEKE